MRKFNDLPIYFIIIGLAINIALSIYARVSFTELMVRSIIVIILFTVMGFVLAEILRNALLNIKMSKNKKLDVKEEVTTSSNFDIRVESKDEDDELLRAFSRPEEDDDNELLKGQSESKDNDFVEINPENFKRFMSQD